MNIVVHIGTEKTGTTTIQELLYQNKSKLPERGFYFLQSPGRRNNRQLPAYCIRADREDDDFFRDKLLDTREKRAAFRSDFVDRLDEEIAAIPPNVETVIASSEHFHSRLVYDDEVEALRTLLAPRFKDIRIITYLRKQVDTAISSYSTGLLSGMSCDIESFLERSYCNPENHYYNYALYLSKWERVFGRENMVVRLFDRKEFVGGNLITDFLMQLDPGLVAHLDTDIVSRNVSINTFGQSLLRAINKNIPQFIEGVGFDRQNIALRDLIMDGAEGEGIGLPEESYRAVQAPFAESNETVRSAYFPQRESLFGDGLAKRGQPTLTERDEALLDLIIGNLSRSRVPEPYADALIEVARKAASNHPDAERHLLKVTASVGGVLPRDANEIIDSLERQRVADHEGRRKRISRLLRSLVQELKPRRP